MGCPSSKPDAAPFDFVVSGRKEMYQLRLVPYNERNYPLDSPRLKYLYHRVYKDDARVVQWFGSPRDQVPIESFHRAGPGMHRDAEEGVVPGSFLYGVVVRYRYPERKPPGSSDDNAAHLSESTSSMERPTDEDGYSEVGYFGIRNKAGCEHATAGAYLVSRLRLIGEAVFLAACRMWYDIDRTIRPFREIRFTTKRDNQMSLGLIMEVVLQAQQFDDEARPGACSVPPPQVDWHSLTFDMSHEGDHAAIVSFADPDTFYRIAECFAHSVTVDTTGKFPPGTYVTPVLNLRKNVREVDHVPPALMPHIERAIIKEGGKGEAKWVWAEDRRRSPDRYEHLPYAPRRAYQHQPYSAVPRPAVVSPATADSVANLHPASSTRPPLSHRSP
jgi:hypothetical protein